MTRLLALALVFSASACVAPRPWTKTDVAMQTALTAELVVDYVQTRQITGDCMESNPMLGECGENLPAEAYFATAAITHAIVAHYLPGVARTVFQSVSLGYQTNVLKNNWSAGYSLAF